MGRKLLAMDIDGTAVCDNYSLGKKSKETIRLAQQEGHIVVFVTGRRDIDMLTLGQDQWIVDYQILNTGGKILRCADRKVLYNDLIPPQVCKRLITYCLKHDIQLQICSGLTWQVTKMTNDTLEYAQNVGVTPETITSLEETDWEQGLEGFMATQNMNDVAAYIDSSVPEVYYVNSEPDCIDIMVDGVSKWKGIQFLADMLGICDDDIITVGNYYNDLDMLHHAAVGIAVANALDVVKEEADFVTESDNNHDAVAEIITKMLHHEYDVSNWKTGIAYKDYKS
nr:Cof-type HAD-IIB family hydrolase [uncultured Faecalimonas sp.]